MGRRILSDYERAVRAAERAQREEERDRVADAKERARQYAQDRQAQTDALNQALEQRVTALQSVLTATLGVDDYLDFERLKKRVRAPSFSPGPLAQPEPAPDESRFVPKP